MSAERVASDDPAVRQLRALAHTYRRFRAAMLSHPEPRVLAACRSEGLTTFVKAGQLWVWGFDQRQPERREGAK